MSERGLVTVAVAVRNRRDLMEACLDGILAQDHPSFEVVIADHQSTDGTYEHLVERAASSPVPLRVVRASGTIGAVRNAALAEARGEVVAWVDSDCVPQPGWIAAGVGALADREVVAQGSTVPDPHGVRPGRRWVATQEITSFSNLYEACNVFYRTEALRAVDGFDEEIGFFGEDTVAGWKVRRLHGSGVFVPDAVVHHAVTYPGLRWHLRRALRYRNWNRLVRLFPEMREDLLWHRWFLRKRSAAFALAAGGVGLSRWWRPAALAAVPYIRMRRPRAIKRAAIAGSIGGAAFDAAVFAGLVHGSIRERELVL